MKNPSPRSHTRAKGRPRSSRGSRHRAPRAPRRFSGSLRCRRIRSRAKGGSCHDPAGSLRLQSGELSSPSLGLSEWLDTAANEVAAHLYREVFGLEVLIDLDEQVGRGVTLKVPVATLELVDVHHERMVDELEAGRPLDHRVRVAVQVDELADAARAVTAGGAEAMAAPVETPWGDHNQRFRTKDG